MQELRKKDREWLMQQAAFKRFMFDILSSSGIASPTRDEQQALFKEGRRSLGLEILGWFDAEAQPFDAIALAIQNKPTPKQGTNND